MKVMHLPMPEELYAELRRAAVKSRRPATRVAREAISRWLEQAKREQVHQDIATYAARWAGTDADLDPALAKAAAGHLRSLEEEDT